MTLLDGSEGQRIGCDGIERSMADCQRKAGEICPRGYDVIGSNGEIYPAGEVPGGFYAEPEYFASAGLTNSNGFLVNRSLIIRCR